MPNPIMTLSEVADLLKVGDKDVDWLKNCGLPVFEVHGAWRCRRDDVVWWIGNKLGDSDPGNPRNWTEGKGLPGRAANSRPLRSGSMNLPLRCGWRPGTEDWLGQEPQRLRRMTSW